MIFNGSGDAAGSVAIGASTSRLPLTQFPCRKCHGRDGEGGGEGNAPSIVWEALGVGTSSRPAYDADALNRMLASGVKSDGAQADTLMPRYELPSDSMRALTTYLDALPTLQRRGIEPAFLRLGVAAPPDNPDVARQYAGHLRRAISALTGDRPIHNRQVVVDVLEGNPAHIVAEAEQRVAAIVGLGPSRQIGVADFTARGVPILFPLLPLDDNEDVSLIRGLISGRQALTRELIADMKAQGYRRVAVIAAGAPAIDSAELALSGIEITALGPSDVIPAGLGAVLLYGRDDSLLATIMERLPTGLPVYAIAAELPSLVSLAMRSGHPLILASGYGKLGNQENGLLQTHARASAALIVYAVRAGGWNITRARLNAAFDRAVFPELALDYRRFPQNGSASVGLLEYAPPLLPTKSECQPELGESCPP